MTTCAVQQQGPLWLLYEMRFISKKPVMQRSAFMHLITLSGHPHCGTVSWPAECCLHRRHFQSEFCTPNQIILWNKSIILYLVCLTMLYQLQMLCAFRGRVGELRRFGGTPSLLEMEWAGWGCGQISSNLVTQNLVGGEEGDWTRRCSERRR